MGEPLPAQAAQSVDEDLRDPAAERLAAFETMLETAAARLRAIPPELDALKAQGREKSVRFRELTAQKLTLQEWLAFARDFGLTPAQPHGR